MNIFINKKQWSQFDEKEMAHFKDDIFNHYRNRGFPYFNITDEKRKDIFEKLKSFDSSSLLQDGNKLKQVMLGLNLANHYMPHMWAVKCNGFVSPMETYLDDIKFKKAIDKRIKLGDNISDAGIRKALCWSNGSQRVSNFRPTVAKYIYDNYAGDGNVLDFSSGYGGRLLGALASDKVKSYTGLEPCIETSRKLIDIVSDFSINKGTCILSKPFEDMYSFGTSFDLAFSSPPYFATERYSDEETQSCNRYKTKEEWKEKFLKVLIEKCYLYLKSGGYFIINIANVKTYPTLEKDTLELASDMGFTPIKTYQMSLSALMASGYKYEPIYVFKKL